LVVSGSTTANTFSATNVTASGNLTFTGTGNRITGDFSNATLANRVAFQNSVTNGSTQINLIPNGTSQTSLVRAINNSNPTNASAGLLYVDAFRVGFDSGITGTGSYLPTTFFTGGSERMRIDTSGNVGIGTSSLLSGAKFQVKTATDKNFFIGTNSVGYLNDAGSSWVQTDVKGSTITFGTGQFAVEAARIDSSGNLLVGKTVTTPTTLGVGVATADGANQWRCSIANSGSTNTAFGLSIYSTGASAYRFYTDMAGTVFATNTTISAISDQRYKENIRDLDVGLDAVMQLRPRKFDWKEGKGQDRKDCRGFIAQEFEQVFPDLIDEWQDPAPEGEEPYKSVRQDLIPVLVKAIQELKAELDTVKAELATLKGQA
jgi:hypothetical protein